MAASAVIMFLSLLVPPLSNAAPAATRNPGTCPSMYVLGVRGSGESSTDSGGLGRTVAAVTDAVAAADPDASVRSVDYPATSVQWWRPSYYTTGYQASVRTGLLNVVAAVEALSREACWAQTPLYLVGYSQGAEIVGDIVQGSDYEGEVLASDLRSHIRAVAMIGDPRFAGSQGLPVDVGTYRPGRNGVASKVGSTLRVVDAADSARIRSYCMANDPVCNFTASNTAACGVGTTVNSTCVHLHYMDIAPETGGPTYTGLAAQFLLDRRAAQLAGNPVITPGPLSQTTNGQLRDIACVRVDACMAVGAYTNRIGARVPVSSVWNGSTWSTTDLPEPAGAHSAVLTHVVCPATTTCVATGTYTDGQYDRPYSTVWDGSRWTVATFAAPGDVRGDAFSVSCPTTSWCLMTGLTAADGAAHASVQSWHDGGWHVETVPSKPGSLFVGLQDLACSDVGTCTAVGYYTALTSPNSAAAFPYSAVYSGGTWSAVAISGTESGYPESLSCLSRIRCIAVGNGAAWRYDGSTWEGIAAPSSSVDQVSCISDTSCLAVSGIYGSGTSSWNGVRWSGTTPPVMGPSSQNKLQATSCVETTCVAVGTSGGEQTSPIAALFAGDTWTPLSVTPRLGAQIATLNGVSCTARRFCVAVGDAQSYTGMRPTAQSWNGSRWAAMVVPAGAGSTSSLHAVSCTDTSFCVAVGADHLVLTWNGTAWHAVRVDVPGPGDFQAVRCTSRSFCITVGTHCVGGEYIADAYRWDGARWTSIDVPGVPASADATLLGVTCPTSGLCYAVGASSTAAGEVPTIKKWTGGQFVNVPATGLPRGGRLNGIDCPTTTTCVAVGRATDLTAYTISSFSEVLQDGAWRRSTTSSDTATYGELRSVSCLSQTSCVGAGVYGPGASATLLAEAWDGRRWALLSPEPEPTYTRHGIGGSFSGPNSEPERFSFVDCSAITTCALVGSVRADFMGPEAYPAAVPIVEMT